MKCTNLKRPFYLRLLAFLLSPFLIILYLILYLPLAMTMKILDRLLSFMTPLRSEQKAIKRPRIIKKEQIPMQIPKDEWSDLLDGEDGDLLTTLLEDVLIRESVISHLEICYNYQITQINDN